MTAIQLAGVAALQLSVVIPCYNEEGGLAAWRRRLGVMCDAIAPTMYEGLSIIPLFITDYLGRLLIQGKARPLFVIATMLRDAGGPRPATPASPGRAERAESRSPAELPEP